MTPQRRFWSRVRKGSETDCWLWTGKWAPGGYGAIKVDGRAIRAHRYSYELANGPIPNGMSVMHTCDNTLCVNPRHLRLGTQADNVRDMIAKGRDRRPRQWSAETYAAWLTKVQEARLRGEQHPHAKLTEAQVLEARRLATEGQSVYDLARMWGVTPTGLHCAVIGKTWKSLPGALPARGIVRGHDVATAHFSEREVISIRMRVRAGESYSAVAREYGVTTTTVRRAATGMTWRHLNSIAPPLPVLQKK